MRARPGRDQNLGRVADGIPGEYLQINGSYKMTPEQRADREHL
jgi:hypothetical protein